MTSLTDKQKEVFENYERTLKDKLLSHEQVKAIYVNLLNSLAEMSSE